MAEILITGGQGYIGSALASYLDKCGPNDIRIADIKGDGYFHDYSNIETGELKEFDTIIHLAGHSSVSSCESDPIGSLLNNVIDFFHFVNRIPDSTKIIYASSASVYGNIGKDKLWKEGETLPSPLKEYDRQKQLIDYYMLQSRKRFYGLRFGTVCGVSPSLRNELLINSMTRDAINKKLVMSENSQNSRAVLGLKDLCRAIERIIDSNPAPGVYNLASFNDKIGNIGTDIAKQFDAGFSGAWATEPKGYSFALDTSKFCKAADFTFEETTLTIAKDIAENLKK